MPSARAPQPARSSRPTRAPRATAGSADGSANVFKGEVEAMINTVRRRLGAIVESVCGGSPRAQDITDRFGIYRKLGWQIWNVVYSDDALAAIRHLPNPRTLKVLHDAARKHGVGDELLGRLDDAIRQFNRSVKNHADDREMLEMLVESQADRIDEASTARWRKQAFTGNAFTFGVRARCMLASVIITPSQKRDGYFDMVRIQGLLGLVRTRSNVRWPFAQLLIRDASGKPYVFDRQPLVESAVVKETGVPLLEAFCSKPLPRVQRRPGQMGGMLEDELLAGEVGASGAADVMTAEMLREVAPVWSDQPGETARFGTGVRTPSELLVSDQLVHRDLYPGVTRELCVYGELMTPLSRDERDRIPVPERVQHLGNVSEGIDTADVPRYGELLKFVFEKTGLNPADFEAYRVRLRYPPLPVSVIVRHELPMRPKT